MIDATEWHEYEALKYEIGALRAHPEIQGYVITEFTDVNWEANGLLDMWRHPKAFGEALSRLQQDDLLILRGDKRNYKDGRDGGGGRLHFALWPRGPGGRESGLASGRNLARRQPAGDCHALRRARPRWGRFASPLPPAPRPSNGF